jgi:hypothetical protein
MRFILGALAAAVIAGVAFVQPAEARCFWNGFEVVCTPRHHFGFYRPHYYIEPALDRPYWWGGY